MTGLPRRAPWVAFLYKSSWVVEARPVQQVAATIRRHDDQADVNYLDDEFGGPPLPPMIWHRGFSAYGARPDSVLRLHADASINRLTAGMPPTPLWSGGHYVQKGRGGNRRLKAVLKWAMQIASDLQNSHHLL